MDKSKYFAAAEKAAQKGQNDKALEAFEAILKADPTDLKALSRAADLHLKEDHVEKGIEYLKRIGEAYTKDGFHSKAVAIFKRILKIDKIPNRSILIETHERMASLYGQLSLISDAMNHFAIVVDYYDQVGDHQSLLNVLKKVSDLDPSNIDTQLRLVDLFMAQQRMEEALETLSQLEASTRSKNSISDLTRVYEKMIDHFPKDFEKLKNLVEILIKANEPKRALARIQHSFKADPKNPQILELLSNTFKALRQPEKSKAVDLELVKLYRQLGNEEAAKSVEARGNQAPPPTVNNDSEPTRRANVTGLSESLDPVDSLIKALPLNGEEKKILSECDVYFKYGLAEKAYEVLKGRLNQFPQSLVLRWKLKVCSQDLKKMDEVAHLLSEIILLARKQNLEIWSNLAASELKGIDPKHSALKSLPSIPTPKPDAPAFKVEESEVSIIVEDEFSEVAEDVSEISFKDLEVSEIKAVELEPEPQEPAEIEIELEAPVEEPVAESSVVEIEPVAEAEAVIEMNDSEPTLVLSDEASETIVLEDLPIALDEPPAVIAETPAAPVAAEEEIGENILSEDDFTFDELQKLDGQLSDTKKAPEPVTPAAAAPIAAAAPQVAAKSEIAQGLEEIDFFESQGLLTEAETLLKSLKEKFPNDAQLKAKTIKSEEKGIQQKSLEVKALGRKVKFNVQEDNREDASNDFFDLAGEIDAELGTSNHHGPAEIRDVFDAFKKGIDATIGKDDWQTHLDLGIAYREMGLLDDALQEFAIVGQVPEQKVSALYQMGLTKMAMEKFKEAEKIFADALKDPKVQSQEKLSLSYELGEVLLKLDDKAKAKSLFEQILKEDPDFREVSLKIKALG